MFLMILKLILLLLVISATIPVGEYMTRNLRPIFADLGVLSLIVGVGAFILLIFK